jgi:LPXTG-site transpeptidase (sortase) family protein
LPVRLRIPAIEVDAPLEALSLGSDGSLDAPAQWGVPGWYSGGPRPGDPGPAVIAGHVDSTSGPAVFYSLSRLRPGDSVYVGVRGGAALHFVVDDIESFAKDRFPTALVYGPLPVPVLRLITCTGAFDRAQRSYVDNLVVSAHLV